MTQAGEISFRIHLNDGVDGDIFANVLVGMVEALPHVDHIGRVTWEPDDDEQR